MRHLTPFVTLALLLSAAAPVEASPGDFEDYYSGGPYRAGKSILLPNGRKGLVIGDFRTIPEGFASRANPGRFAYAVMLPKPGPVDATKDCPEFGLWIAMVAVEDGRLVVGPPADLEKWLATQREHLSTLEQRVLAETEEGRKILTQAGAMLAKWNARNDRSIQKLTTTEGFTSLLTDMALAGGADRLKKRLKTTGDLDRIFQEAVIDAVKENLSGHLPWGPSGPEPETAAAAELTKGSIKAILTARLREVPEGGRADVLTKLLVQFGALALDKGGDESLAEVAFEAAADVAVELGISRYPIAGPLAKEALELAKQLRGYLQTLDKLSDADKRFVGAMNAYNESYGIRQAITLAQKHRREMLERSSNALYAEDPELEGWLIEHVADRLARERTERLAGLALDLYGLDADPERVRRKSSGIPLYDPWRIPDLIENAGREAANLEFDLLKLDEREFLPEKSLGFDLGRYDSPDRGERLLRPKPYGTIKDDFTDDMRRIFRATPEYKPFESRRLPPVPTRDERKLLERDCRLKRMAQAERLLPRIGPKAREVVALRRAIEEQRFPPSDEPVLLILRRHETTAPLYTLEPGTTKKAAPAGMRRD